MWSVIHIYCSAFVLVFYAWISTAIWNKKQGFFPTLCNCLSFIYLLSSIVINFFQNCILNLEVSKLGITAQPTLLLSIFYEINNQESGREAENVYATRGFFFLLGEITEQFRLIKIIMLYSFVTFLCLSTNP